MGTMTNAASVAQAATTVESARHYVEMLKVQLDILRRLNAAPKVIEVVEQALSDAETEFERLQHA
jgi:hypothetical protein